MSTAAPKAWTLADILEKARLPERVIELNLRGDLDAELDLLVADLATLVDRRKQAGDKTDAEAAEAEETELRDRVRELTAESAAGKVRVRLRALTSSRRDELLDQYSDDEGKVPRESEKFVVFMNTMLAEMLVEPVATVEQVASLRSVLGAKAMNTLTNAALTLG